MGLEKHVLVLAFCLSVMPVVGAAEEQVKGSFSDYVATLKQLAADKGISLETINDVFPKIKRFKKAQVGKTNEPVVLATLDTYLPNAVPQSKVDTARAFYKQHQQQLITIGKHYGVQPRFIVAILGVDANFGKLGSNYSVLSVSASLAFAGEREAFYQKQFIDALKIIERDNIAFADLKSNSTGKMGLNQFNPSIYLDYAQDGDGDGKKDIWSNTSDAFASIAYYLQQNGWKDSQTWGRQVKVPVNFNPNFAGLKIEKTFTEWQSLGVTRFDGSTLPKRHDMYVSMVMPDGVSGRKYLVYGNYRSLRSWKDSDYFAITVSYLSERIKFPGII